MSHDDIVVCGDQELVRTAPMNDDVEQLPQGLWMYIILELLDEKDAPLCDAQLGDQSNEIAEPSPIMSSEIVSNESM
jgi:hypothetical protein